MSEKFTKAEVNYGKPAGGSRNRCFLCAHFEPPHACEIVEGRINPDDLCDRFKRAAT